MNPRVNLSVADVGQLEEDYVTAAIRSGWVTSLGPDVDAFESELAAYVGVEHCVALSSGTAALHLGLLTLGAGPGDVVLTSTLTFAATANAIVYTGSEPFFIDSEESTGNIDPGLLDEVLCDLTKSGERVAAILPVDLLGKCADYSRIEPIAAKYGVPILADAAESLGAEYNGKSAGSFGAAAAVSFNGNKIITTSGGGALLTRDSRIADRARFLSTQARERTRHYEHRVLGFNYRMSNILAALGRAQLSRIEHLIERRKTVRAMYRRLFAGVPGVTILGGLNDQNDNNWLTSILIDDKITKWTAIEMQDFLQERNIESRPLWKPMHLQPLFADTRSRTTGIAEELFRKGLTLPSGSSLSDSELDYISSALSEFCERDSNGDN